MPRAQELSQSRHCFGAILPYLRRAVRRTVENRANRATILARLPRSPQEQNRHIARIEPITPSIWHNSQPNYDSQGSSA